MLSLRRGADTIGPPPYYENSPMQLSDRTVLITGGSSGIGLALAEGFAERGCRVLICGRTEEKLKQAQERVPSLVYLKADVTVEADRRRLLDWVEAEHPATDVLVNNAGIQCRVELTDGAESIDTGEIALNLQAPIHLAALFIPRFLRHADEGRSPAIINVTSGLGYVSLAATPIYGATKVGLQAFTQALRYQLRDKGIEVVDLAPPTVDTPLLKRALGPNGGTGPPAITPERFAREALRGLEKGRSEVRVGGAQMLYVLNRLAPRLAFRLLNRIAS